MGLLIGADPEIFVQKNGEFVSGHIFRCGTKSNPQKTKHGSVQVDGVALEFNVMPAEHEDDFISNVRNGLGDLQEIIKEKGSDYLLIPEPCVLLTEKYLDRLPKSVRQLGCTVDFNAYTLGPNPPPDSSVLIRTCSGHIHLGWKNDEDQGGYDYLVSCAPLVRELDIFVGLPSLDWDPDPRRRELYGQAGCFRPKSYGLEYRTLSNLWITNAELMRKVFRGAQRAFRNWQEGKLLSDRYSDFVRVVINEHKLNWKEKAPQLCKEIENA